MPGGVELPQIDQIQLLLARRIRAARRALKIISLDDEVAIVHDVRPRKSKNSATPSEGVTNGWFHFDQVPSTVVVGEPEADLF